MSRKMGPCKALFEVHSTCQTSRVRMRNDWASRGVRAHLSEFGRWARPGPRY
jgi:hypothetical protein